MDPLLRPRPCISRFFARREARFGPFGVLEHEARDAAGRRELDGADPSQLAFELGVILAGTNIVSVIHSDDGAIERARTAIHRLLEARSIAPGPTRPTSA